MIIKQKRAKHTDFFPMAPFVPLAPLAAVAPLGTIGTLELDPLNPFDPFEFAQAPARLASTSFAIENGASVRNAVGRTPRIARPRPAPDCTLVSEYELTVGRDCRRVSSLCCDWLA